MVLFVPVDGAGAVYLFGEDQSYQLMREYQLAEAPLEIGALHYGFIDAVCTTDQEDKILHPVGCPGINELCELFRAELFASFIEGNQVIIFLQHAQNNFSFLFLEIGFAEGGCVLWTRDDIPLNGVVIGYAVGEVGDAFFNVAFMFFSDGPELEFHDIKING